MGDDFAVKYTKVQGGISMGTTSGVLEWKDLS